ncbi:unnamed protein product [Closterium sp. NIES-64]|nr:unnamed protein product [Closterium sp. NIES-64]
MYIALYYVVARLPDSFASSGTTFSQSVPPPSTVDLLEKALLAAEKSIVAVGQGGQGRGWRLEGRWRWRRGGGGSGGGGGTSGGGGGGGGGEHAAETVVVVPAVVVEAAAEVEAAEVEAVEAAAEEAVVVEEVELVGVVPSSVAAVVGGQLLAAAAAAALADIPSPQQLREWVRWASEGWGTGPCTYVLSFRRPRGAGVAIFDLDFDAILTAMYVVDYSEENEGYRCFQPDPGIGTAALGACEAAALGASASALSGTGETALSGTASSSSSLTFTLDSGASRSFFRDRTTLTPLGRPVAVSLADPSGVLSCLTSPLSSRVRLPPSGTLSGLYLPSFSTNLVSGADLQDVGVHQFTPASQRVTHCTEARTGRHLATFSRRPGSSLYTLTVESPPVPASGQVAASGQVLAAASRSGPESAPCSCRLLSHETLLWHHRLGHPSLPRLRSMASRVLVSGLPQSLPPLPSGQDLPVPRLWAGYERYFLLVVDDYSRYTTVLPLRSKGEVTEVLIDWIREARLQLRKSFGSDFPVLRLHSDRGGEFSSRLLRDYCRARGIRQTFTLPDSPQQNGIAERRIGMVMDLNLHPRVSRPAMSPALLWTGKVGDASVFRVWGSRAFVRDLSADKLSPRAAPCVFLGFPTDAPWWQFYHPSSRRVLSSQDVTFDESVPFYRLFPYRTPSLPPPPDFLVPVPPPVDPLPPQVPAPSGVSQVDAVDPVEVTGDSGAAAGAEPGGADSGGAVRGGAEPRGATAGGAGPDGTTAEGAEPGGAEPGGAVPGGAGSGGAGSGAAEPGVLSWELLGLGVLRLELLSLGRAAESGGAAGAGAGASSTSRVRVLPVPELLDLRVLPELELLRALGAGAVPAASGAAARPRPYFVPLLQQVLGLSPPVEGPPPVQSQSLLEPSSPLPAPSPYTGPTGGLAERLSLPALADPGWDSLRAASPTVTRLLANVVTDPSFESTAASALVAELVDFAARCRLDYAASLVAESASVCPPSVGGECALGTDVLEDRQEELQHPDSAFLREAVEGPYSSQWQAAMDAEMASWKSTGTYVDAVPPPGANIVSGMWIFRVKRPPGSPPVFKARYVARGFSQRQGVDYFQTFSPTPKMTTLRVLLHIAAQRDYELHSLDFSTAFLQGSLHEEIWLRRPPGFTGTFPPGTQWSLRRPVYGLRQAPREWHDTLRTTLAALGFAPSTADPSLFLRTDTSLPPFYILVYVDDLVFATADTAGLAYVKSELLKRHTCTHLGELRSYLGLQITRDRARRTITLTQSHMVQQSFSASASRTPRLRPLLCLLATHSQLCLRMSP